MKTAFSIVLAALCAALQTNAQERYVHLTLPVLPTEANYAPGIPYTNLAVQSGESAEILNWSRSGNWRTYGALYSGFRAGTNDYFTGIGHGDIIIGPAVIQLAGEALYWYTPQIPNPPPRVALPGYAFATVRIRPVNASAASAAVKPAGLPAKVKLESTVDLVTWTSDEPGDIAPETVNRFYRVRIDAPTIQRAPPAR